MANLNESIKKSALTLDKENKCVSFDIKLEDEAIVDIIYRTGMPNTDKYFQPSNFVFTLRTDGSLDNTEFTATHKKNGAYKIDLSDEEKQGFVRFANDEIETLEKIKEIWKKHEYSYDLEVCGKKSLSFKDKHNFQSVEEAVANNYELADFLNVFEQQINNEEDVETAMRFHSLKLIKTDALTNEKTEYTDMAENLYNTAYEKIQQTISEIEKTLSPVDLEAEYKEDNIHSLFDIENNYNKIMEIYAQFKQEWIKTYISEDEMSLTEALYDVCEDESIESFEEYVENYGFADGGVYHDFETFVAEDLETFTDWKDKLELSPDGVLYFNELDTGGDPVPSCTVMLEKDTGMAVVHYEDDGLDVILDLNDPESHKQFEDTLDYFFEERGWGFNTRDEARSLDDAPYIRPIAPNDIAFVDVENRLMCDAYKDKCFPNANVPITFTDEGLDNLLEKTGFYKKEGLKDFEDMKEKGCSITLEGNVLMNEASFVYFEIISETPDSEYQETEEINLSDAEYKTLYSEINKAFEQTCGKSVQECIREYAKERGLYKDHKSQSVSKED